MQARSLEGRALPNRPGSSPVQAQGVQGWSGTELPEPSGVSVGVDAHAKLAACEAVESGHTGWGGGRPRWARASCNGTGGRRGLRVMAVTLLVQGSPGELEAGQ